MASFKGTRNCRAKIRKLFRNPSLFWRDYFLKRAPLETFADINRVTHADALASNGVSTISENRPSTGMVGNGRARTSVETVISGYINFCHDVDVVITWVDGSDQEFLRQREKFRDHDTSGKVASNSSARYQNHDEVRYCIRSILQYAPWVRKIYLVTNGQIPRWFSKEQDKVSIVTHDEIIPSEYLPTFNSHVIESCLHRINGLSEHYVYFNDDVMLLRPVEPTDFFTETGLMRGFISKATIPNGPPVELDTPSMIAIKNARKLLFENTGFYLSPKFAHTYHPQRKSVAKACESQFEDQFHECRKNKFRNNSDILCTSFLFPCYAYITGQGVFSRLRAWYFNVRDVAAKSLYTKLHNFKASSDGPISVCLNDHLPDSLQYNFEYYREELARFLQTYYDVAFSFEIDRNSNVPVCEIDGIGEQVKSSTPI